MSKRAAKLEAIRRAAAELASGGAASRLRLHGFALDESGRFPLRVFGQDLFIASDTLTISAGPGEEAPKLDDQILIYHYLLNETRIQMTGELIAFRELPGGQFYWEPFLSRSVKPLVKRTGNDLEGLKRRLDRFDWKLAARGDFAAVIHAIGAVSVTLVYHLGDEEFPPDASLLFDQAVKRAFNTEDAAVIASRICLGLL